MPHAFQVHVGAAKAGINMMMKNLALEWGHYGIRINSIVPGPIEGTEGLKRLSSAEAKQILIDAVPMRRMGTVDQISARPPPFLPRRWPPTSPAASLSVMADQISPVRGDLTRVPSRCLRRRRRRECGLRSAITTSMVEGHFVASESPAKSALTLGAQRRFALLLASTTHHETAARIGRDIAIAVGLALSQAAVAAPPDSPDPALAPWFESLKQPGTGAPCCSIADCRTVEFRQDRDGYEVLIDSRWKMSNPFWLRVPSNRIIDKSTTQRTAAWFASRLRLAFYVSCVRPRVNRQCRRSPSRIAWEHSHAAIEERFCNSVPVNSSRLMQVKLGLYGFFASTVSVGVD